MSTLLDVDWSSLPQPEDDGGADHLAGSSVVNIALAASDGQEIDLSALTGRTVVYIYPMTGRPDVPLPDGWDFIPGARGCTPQSCAFRDHHDDLKQLGVDHLFGLSTQTSDYQLEASERLHLPFALLSDVDLKLTQAMNLPTMKVEGNTFLKRMTLIIKDGVIEHVFYPVFPPDQSAQDVMSWLKANPSS